MTNLKIGLHFKTELLNKGLDGKKDEWDLRKIATLCGAVNRKESHSNKMLES